MNRWKAIASTLALCIGLSGGAWAQQQRDRGLWDIQNGTTNGHYDRGQQDRDHDGDRDDHDVWERRHRNDHDRDDRYRNGRWGYNNGRYGRGYNGRNQASQIGFQDGLNDGRDDYQARRNFQPQKDWNYKHADRGYNSSFGDKNSYKQTYRDAYLRGYRQSYGQGYWR